MKQANSALLLQVKRYWNTNESVNPEEGQEDKDKEREEEEDGDGDSFDEDTENAFVEKGRKLLEQLSNTTHEDNVENDAEKANDKENIDRELLIECVRQFPIIWNPKHPNHKDNTKKKIIWQKIQRESFNERDG